MPSVSKGIGRTNAQGKTVSIESLYAWVAKLPAENEGWWSPHCWERSYRKGDEWTSACGVAVDVDSTSNGDSTPSPDVDALVNRGGMPGSFWHLTPHGARVVFEFDDQCIDHDLMLAAMQGACALVAKHFDGLAFAVDTGASLADLTRFFYSPRAHAKGVQRDNHVVSLRREPFTVSELGKHAPAKPAQTSTPVPGPPTREPSPDYAEAVRKFNDEHPLDVKRHTQKCPVCEDSGSFGHMPNDKQRWACFSTDHSRSVGVAGSNCMHGDSLDLYAHENGVNPATVLVKLGYLAPRSKAITVPSPDKPTVTDGNARPNRNNSALTAMQVVGRESDGNGRGALRGKLAWNELTDMIEYDGEPLQDHDVTEIRCAIELQYVGGVNQNGDQVGLKVSKSDVIDAVQAIAHRNSYHPVRDYLAPLAWDGIKRIDLIPSAVLGAEDTEINRAMMRKTMISAVARVFDPGCKVDTMLVLQGKQGALKSTFFAKLASPWFIDTPVDISTDATRAYQVMRRAWMYEWAELETLLKARDISTAKAFLSSREDTYIAKYGRHPVVVKRSGVIVGTINPMQFLEDETGARRFWVISVGEHLNLVLIDQWRDSLWAEAVHYYRDWAARGRPDGERLWWLTPEEETQLIAIQEDHRVSDAWEDVIIPWAGSQPEPFTTGRVLAVAMGKPEGAWTRGDEMRIAKVLKHAGYERKSHGDSRAKKWRKVAA